MSLQSNAGRVAASLLLLLGLVFLVVPLTADSYSHYLQNKAYQKIHDKVISCRASVALKLIDGPYMAANGFERRIDATCGLTPKYEDLQFDTSNGILSFYSWLGQKVTFIPL